MTASVARGSRWTAAARTALSVAAVAVALGHWSGAGAWTAGVLLATSTGRFEGVTGLAGSLVAGIAVGGGLGFGFASAGGVATPVGVGLGAALGGGLGAVSQYAVAGTEDESANETVTVEMEDTTRSPQPADLFDGHPDPILYVADEGHGPVVRAANAAYEEAFGVPADGVTGAPLDEALLIEETAAVADAVAAGEQVDRRVTCETPDGEREFRLRSTVADGDGYLLYTPI